MVGKIEEFNKAIKKRLPVTYDILLNSNLSVHPYVYKVVLSGSRGLAGNYRKDSDIDLSLLVDITKVKEHENEEDVLRDILNYTIANWKGEVELDTAAVFDIKNCNLKCFNYEKFEECNCHCGGIDCIGLFKIQKGFSGYLTRGIEIKRIYPLITVWERDQLYW